MKASPAYNPRWGILFYVYKYYAIRLNNYYSFGKLGNQQVLSHIIKLRFFYLYNTNHNNIETNEYSFLNTKKTNTIIGFELIRVDLYSPHFICISHKFNLVLIFRRFVGFGGWLGLVLSVLGSLSELTMFVSGSSESSPYFTDASGPDCILLKNW